MVDRIEFSPLGGIDPRQLFAQRDARQALVNSLATEAPRISAPGPRPAPEAPPQVERPEREERPRDEAERQQNVAGPQPNTAAALGGAEEPGGAAQEENAPPAVATGPARFARDVFNIPVPGTDQARAEGAPLFGGGGFGPSGPANPLVRDITPLGETGRREGTDFGPRPLGRGGVPDTPPTLAAQTTGAPQAGRPEPPAPTPQNAVQGAGQTEPRGLVVDVLV